ncbi:uncharacterized protein NECHADRAFT_64974 [Fusarium vanettenii 77-13-4]|uniref:Major facilitator superfamily (MFS) profile domain-containing protein n=1 Tax=Fusarium vanettenii (strain ATCC MYA-4622 / CBS 123669 / FGSC 9596 / NRRL 45880 / 77-13-4) TaxID=660122 RepID=C7ZQG3_FUSV7|nr:uncharacterized protein NECHADRAFT_64974 [Fusarium vanettenii 77-13-4]EEU33741.1 hypothetical protein NECHADRAFT_64974 [Fusarium vanettenii 77-13-4]
MRTLPVFKVFRQGCHLHILTQASHLLTLRTPQLSLQIPHMGTWAPQANMERDSDTQTTSKQAIKVHMKTWIVVTCVNFAYFSQLTAVIGSGFLAQSIAQLLGGASQTMWFNQSINLLGIAICLPVSQMADYWGRRWVLIVLLAIGFAGTMVVARAQNVATVIAGFVLIGVSYGATPVLFAVPSEVLPRSQRSIAQSTINMSSSIGGILSLQFGMFTGSDMLISGIAFGMFFIVGGLATIVFGWASTKYRITRMPGILCLGLIVLFNVLMATTTPSTPEANYWGYAIFAGLGLGGTIPTFMVAAQLTTPPELISLVSGLVSVARPIGGVVGLAINNAIFHESLSTELRKKISAAVIPLGFSASSLDALISAITGGDEGALSEISGASPDIIAAAQGGQMKAYGIAFRNCWIAAACLCLPGVFVAFWAIDPRSEFKDHIDAPVEVEVAEEQKRLEALQVEDVKDELKIGKD